MVDKLAGRRPIHVNPEGFTAAIVRPLTRSADVPAGEPDRLLHLGEDALGRRDETGAQSHP